MNLTNAEMMNRQQMLFAMHRLMMEANDENLYMRWITYGVPDEPSEDDFEFIASREDLFEETKKLFVELVSDENY